MKNDNVINLVDYIQNKKAIEILKNKKTDQPSLWKRIKSFCLDLYIVFALKSLVDISFMLFAQEYFPMLSVSSRLSLSQMDIGYHLFNYLLIYTGYFMCCPLFLNGQTIGQYKNKIYVTDKNGSDDLRVTTYFKRASGFLMYYLGFGLFQTFYFFSDEKRSFVDQFSNTYLSHHVEQSDSNDVLVIDIEKLVA